MHGPDLEAEVEIVADFHTDSLNWIVDPSPVELRHVCHWKVLHHHRLSADGILHLVKVQNGYLKLLPDLCQQMGGIYKLSEKFLFILISFGILGGK